MTTGGRCNSRAYAPWNGAYFGFIGNRSSCQKRGKKNKTIATGMAGDGPCCWARLETLSPYWPSFALKRSESFGCLLAILPLVST